MGGTIKATKTVLLVCFKGRSEIVFHCYDDLTVSLVGLHQVSSFSFSQFNVMCLILSDRRFLRKSVTRKGTEGTKAGMVSARLASLSRSNLL